jgi:hypothetical protein
MKLGQCCLVASCGFLGLVGALAPPLVGQAGAQSDIRAYSARAEAAGFFAQFGIPGFLAVDNYVDAGGPLASATMESGRSASNASLPYPGDAALSAPALGGLVLGVVLPAYPLYVRAEDPAQPKQALADPTGAYTLSAEANKEMAGSSARVGAPANPGDGTVAALTTIADVKTVGDTVVANASSRAEGIVVGPLSLGVVRSRSSTTYVQGREGPISDTEFVIEGGRVGSMGFNLTPGGFRLGDQETPVPVGEGLAALNEALAPSGLSVRFSEARSLQGGKAAATLDIVGDMTVPGAGEGRLLVRFGAAISSVVVGDASGYDALASGPNAMNPSARRVGGGGQEGPLGWLPVGPPGWAAAPRPGTFVGAAARPVVLRAGR